MGLPYEARKGYACDVCGNVPDEDGMIEHGRGCYTQSSEGGGFSFVDLPPDSQGDAVNKPDAAARAAERIIDNTIPWHRIGDVPLETRQNNAAAIIREELADDVRELLDALEQTVPYVEDAYEGPFPDAAANSRVLAAARAVLAKHGR